MLQNASMKAAASRVLVMSGMLKSMAATFPTTSDFAFQKIKGIVELKINTKNGVILPVASLVLATMKQVMSRGKSYDADAVGMLHYAKIVTTADFTTNIRKVAYGVVAICKADLTGMRRGSVSFRRKFSFRIIGGLWGGCTYQLLDPSSITKIQISCLLKTKVVIKGITQQYQVISNRYAQIELQLVSIKLRILYKTEQ